MSTVPVDVTPGAHRHTQALATVTFRLACGCRSGSHARDDDYSRAVELKSVGSEYECRIHGNQVIIRATFRLTGWRDDGLDWVRR